MVVSSANLAAKIALTDANFRKNEDGSVTLDVQFPYGVRMDGVGLSTDFKSLEVIGGGMVKPGFRLWRDNIGDQGGTPVDGRAYASNDGMTFDGYLQAFGEDVSQASDQNGALVRFLMAGLPTATYLNDTFKTDVKKAYFNASNKVDGQEYYELTLEEGKVHETLYRENSEVTNDIATDGSVAWASAHYHLELNDNGTIKGGYIRLYPAAAHSEDMLNHMRSFHLKVWEGPISDNLATAPDAGGDGLDFRFDAEKTRSANDGYSYFRADVVADGEDIDATQFLTQYSLTTNDTFGNYDAQYRTGGEKANDAVNYSFDVRMNNRWDRLTRYDNRIGQARIKFGVKPHTLWIRANWKETNPYRRYEVMVSETGGTVESDSKSPDRNYNRYYLTVKRGTQLFSLMKGTMSDAEEDLELTLQKKVSHPGYYQLNLGRRVTLNADQPFDFVVRSVEGNEEVNPAGWTLHTANVNSRVGGTADMNVIKAGTSFDRIILHLKRFPATGADDYEMWLNDGIDKLPYHEVTTQHPIPYLKTWTSPTNNNDSEGFIDDENMPEPVTVSGATHYYAFHRVDWQGNVLDDNSPEQAHPNVFYLPLKGGVTLSEGVKPEAVVSGEYKINADREGQTGDHVTFFNLSDEDGYDVGNPMQGGQWFFADTWWAANPRIVPEDTEQTNGDWQPETRYKYGTPGDLVVGEEMTCYGITIFRIAGERFDMYRDVPANEKFTEGNLYYLYFNTKQPESDADYRAEMTAPILLNMQTETSGLTPTEGTELKYYEGRDFLYPAYDINGREQKAGRYYNIVDYGTRHAQPRTQRAAGTEAPKQRPILLTCTGIAPNGDALYVLNLDKWTPGEDAPFEFISTTGDLYWNANHTDAQNDRLRPSKYSYYYYGSSQTVKRIEGESSNVDIQANVPTGDGAGVQHNGLLYVNDKDMSYTHLVMATNADNVRYMLQANVPTLEPGTKTNYEAHNLEKQGTEEYGHLIYPEVTTHVQVPLNAQEYKNAAEPEPIYIIVRVSEPGKEQPTIFFYEYTNLNFGDNLASYRGTATATVRRVELQFDYENMSVKFGDDGKPLFADNAESYPSYSTTLSYHGEQAEEDLFLNTGEVMLDFDYAFAMDPHVASAQSSCIINNNYNRNSSTPRVLDYNPAVNGVDLTVYDNALYTADGTGDGTTYDVNYAFSPVVDNQLPRTYAVYEYNPQNSFFSEGDGIGWLNDDGTLLPEYYSQAIGYTDEFVKVWSEKENTAVTHTTNRGTAAITMADFATGGTLRMGYFVVMTYTLAYPAEGIELRETTSTTGTPVDPQQRAEAPQTYDYTKLPEGYTTRTVEAFDSDYGEIAYQGCSVTELDDVLSGTVIVNVAPGVISVSGTAGIVRIYTVDGSLVAADRAGRFAVAPGMYIVHTHAGAVKVMVP